MEQRYSAERVAAIRDFYLGRNEIHGAGARATGS
jgi:hypothetical protein